MKRVLVTFVLALTTAAWGQGSTPSQQPPAKPAAAVNARGRRRSGQSPTSQKVIKDPAEYNAYITALNTTDPAAKAQAMEAFVAQYPNSIVKIEALEQAMRSVPAGPNNQPAKVEQFARQILQMEPNNVRALAIVVFLERAPDQGCGQRSQSPGRRRARPAGAADLEAG